MSVGERFWTTIDIISFWRSPVLNAVSLLDQVALGLPGEIWRLGDFRQSVEAVADGADFGLLSSRLHIALRLRPVLGCKTNG